MTFAAQGTSAQVYPARPVRLIVGFAAGGGSDILARALAQHLGDAIGQPVVVDNRTGAGGIIATEMGARAPADGHTLLMASAAAFSINPHLKAKLPYDVWKDFTPVAMMATLSYLLNIHPSVPARSVKDLVSLANARPGRLNYGSAGPGATSHMATVLFETLAGVSMQHVPYKGAAPALTDLLAGQIDVLFDAAITTMPHVTGGRVRPLAVSTSRRTALFPELPTVSEAGVAGYESGNWFGIVGPAGLSNAVVEKLNAAISRIMVRADVRQRLLTQGIDPLAGSVDEFVAMLRREHEKYGRIVRISGLRPE